MKLTDDNDRKVGYQLIFFLIFELQDFQNDFFYFKKISRNDKFINFNIFYFPYFNENFLSIYIYRYNIYIIKVSLPRYYIIQIWEETQLSQK